MKTVMQRFSEKVEIRGGEQCWPWLASKNKYGYGRFRMGSKKTTAHRASYLLFNGPIEGDSYILHSCDNRWCVNPDHLRTGTAADNSSDMSVRGRSCKGKPVVGRRSYKGEDSPVSKISHEDALKILVDPRRHADIAEQYGVTKGAISHLKRGFTWSHLKR